MRTILKAKEKTLDTTASTVPTLDSKMCLTKALKSWLTRWLQRYYFCIRGDWQREDAYHDGDRREAWYYTARRPATL